MEVKIYTEVIIRQYLRALKNSWGGRHTPAL